MNRRNDCKVAGAKAEHRFADALTKLGRKIRFATENENLIGKWDVCTTNDDGSERARFDVKTVKLGGPSGSLLLELKGISGYAGWLYGEADYIAFEKDRGGFAVFNRGDLADLIETDFLSDGGTYLTHPPYLWGNLQLTRDKPRYGYAVNNFYGRPNRKDVFIYLDAGWVMDKLDFWEV
jgi:hypothetical protein